MWQTILTFIILASAGRTATDYPVITVLYDNTVYKEDSLVADWGFSCLIEGYEKNILFDTGGNGEILLSNMQHLGVDPKKIDIVFLSHRHWDHIGGLEGLLAENSDVEVHILPSLPKDVKNTVRRAGAKLVESKEPKEIIPGVFSTGKMGEFIPEQSLVLSTPSGNIVITGCAHPGVVNITEKAKENFGEILFVMGGFHLMSKTEGQLVKIIKQMKELGVQYVAPSHCSGASAERLFERDFGKKFIRLGVGRKIDTKNLAER